MFITHAYSCARVRHVEGALEATQASKKTSKLQTIALGDTCQRDTYSQRERICREQQDHSFLTSQHTAFSS